MFNLAIDSKLRGCDLVALRVDDVAPNGYAIDRANVRQRKTGRPVRFELTEPTRQALDDYLRGSDRNAREPVPGISRSEPTPDNAPVRPAGIEVGCRHWSRSVQIRHAFYAPNQSDADLPSHWESACGATFARPFQDRLCPMPDYVPSRYDPVCGQCERVSSRDIVHVVTGL